MVGEMSSILRELEKVQDQLSSLARDSEAERFDLLTRREELQTRAARLAENADAEYSTQQLLIQLAKLRRRRDVLNRQRHATGPGGHGPGVSQVEDQISRIRALLIERGIRVL